MTGSRKATPATLTLNGGLEMSAETVGAIREVLLDMRKKLVEWDGKLPPRWNAEAPQDPPQDYTSALHLTDCLLALFDPHAGAGMVVSRAEVGELQSTLFKLFDGIHWLQRRSLVEEQDKLLTLTHAFSSAQYRCTNCNDERWVCCYHPHVHWEECECGAAEGTMCPVCNFGGHNPGSWVHTFASRLPEDKSPKQ
jgi:hypothetical protein